MAACPELGDPNFWTAVHERMAKSLRSVEEAEAPERMRQILDERARALAEPPPADQPIGETIDVIRFELTHERFAIEACYVREVLRLQAFTPVPGAATFVLGISNIRGELLPLFDLRHFFNLDPRGVTDLRHRDAAHGWICSHGDDTRIGTIQVSPVVLLTARETEQDKARGLQLGADAYMLKSTFDQRQLLEAIAQLA